LLSYSVTNVTFVTFAHRNRCLSWRGIGEINMLKYLAVAAVLLSTTAAHAETFAIQAGRLIVDASQPARGPSTVIVENGRIARIESGATAPAGATVVDMTSKTVMPGLIDAHVHLTSDPGTPFWREAIDSDESAAITGVKNALLTARAGFTTVRDLGAPGYASLALRDAIAQGTVPGPRVIASGGALSITGGHGDSSGFRESVNKALMGDNTCSGAADCAEATRRMAKRGVDVIKITSTGGVLSQQGRGLEGHFTPAEVASIVEVAGRLGLKVAAHAHGARGIEEAAAAGVASIEHGTFADAAGLRVMKAKGTWMVPTLLALSGVNDRLGKGIYTAVVEAKGRQAIAAWGKQLAAAKAMGVKIAYGTDAGVFEHGRNGEEAALMVKLGGMTPREVLVSATRDAAELLGLSAETGTLDIGKSADLIAVEGDPSADAGALTKVRYVMAAGRVVPMR
jgi:imidazolonepropionase-like amidohydrolase